jgi:hypothetical protein|tara:strand:+ start:1653 stop:2207 length:555 start_codon:yes stop_codon:yes gene_type:complete
MAQYQEGQYINQFLNTMPQQLLQHSRYKENQRQFDANYRQRNEQFDERSRQFDQRSRQFDDAKSLRERHFNLQEDNVKRQLEEKSLIDLLLRGQHEQDIEISERQARKNALLEDVPFGTGLWKALPWTETVDEWAQKKSGLDEIINTKDIPEGLQISPKMYQLLKSLPAYNAPSMNLLNMAGGQ